MRTASVSATHALPLAVPELLAESFLQFFNTHDAIRSSSILGLRHVHAAEQEAVTASHHPVALVRNVEGEVGELEARLTRDRVYRNCCEELMAVVAGRKQLQCRRC